MLLQLNPINPSKQMKHSPLAQSILHSDYVPKSQEATFGGVKEEIGPFCHIAR
jgi:hypothetical protein